MSTSVEFVEYVCEQIGVGRNVRYRKMFGDYTVYVNDKPLLLVCDDVAYVKILPQLSGIMSKAGKGVPYDGAKEHYILDIDDRESVNSVVEILEEVTPLPRKRK